MRFLRTVDASCVLINASTRFNDVEELGLIIPDEFGFKKRPQVIHRIVTAAAEPSKHADVGHDSFGQIITQGGLGQPCLMRIFPPLFLLSDIFSPKYLPTLSSTL